MTITNNFVAKLSVAFVAVAMAFALAAPVKAQDVSSMSLEQLIALVNQLQAQLSGSTGSTGTCSYTFTRSLSQGSTGADVMNLQKFLNSMSDTTVAVSGAGSAGMETSYYGPATAAAVSKFQTKYSADILVPSGLTSPTGYFGPSTMAKANALCTSTGTGTGTGTGTSGSLQGGAGALTDIKLMAGISNEDVGEGEEDVEVYGVELEADNSDVELTAVTVVLTKGTASSNRFNRYADDVSIWLDGSEVARVNASDFTSSNSYTRTVTLKKGAIIRDGNVGELVIAVSGVTNLDSDYADQTWNAKFSSVRFVDAQGASITDSAVNSLSTRTMTFKDFASASALKFKLASGDSSINTSRTIKVSSTTKTSDVAVASFKGTVEGSSDMNLDKVVVSYTGTGGGDSGKLDGIITAAYLYIDGSRVQSTSTIPNTATGKIVFDKIDYDMDAGDSYNFEVRVDVKALSAAATLDVDVSTADRNAWTIEDEKGDNVIAADRSGSASADAHNLVLQGVNIALGSVTTKEVYNSNNVAASYGEFRMEVKVTAIGDTIYVKETAASSSSAVTTHGVAYIFENSAGTQAATASSTTGSFTRKSGGTVDGSSIRVDEGSTVTFEFVGTFDPTAADQFRARIVGVGFGLTNTGTGSSQTATPAADFRSGLQTISN